MTRNNVYILGISGLYHDSAAALLKDGIIIAAAQEERFSRKKHDCQIPISAIQYCLKEGNIQADNLDYVVYYEKPLLKFDRILETYFTYAPKGFHQFLNGMPVWLKQKLHIASELDKALKNSFKDRYIFTEHHESHAASAFFPSPFSEATIVTMDGVGEWATASIGIGRGNKIELLYELRFPHSLGLLYSTFTSFAGFKVNSGEYKLMGLAPYGKPIYKDIILNKLLDLKDDGSFRLNLDYFSYCHKDIMPGQRFNDIFNGPPRTPGAVITQREMDIAASIQKVTEDIILRIIHYAYNKTNIKYLVMAGGVALNCVSNGRILREGPYNDLWIQPSAGDAGGALGAALFVHYQLLNNERIIMGGEDSQAASLLGPQYSNQEIKQYLDSVGAVYQYIKDEELLLEQIAMDITHGKVIGWFTGRMEFGPRSLGNRSILADARNENMQSHINQKIKYRESFRPFAPSILKEDASEYFSIDKDKESPYMLIVAPVKNEIRINIHNQHEDISGIDLLNIKRSTVPAITHVDYSARIQTVDQPRHGRYYRLIEKFKQLTGCPLIINTSFNIKEEPIVCSPKDAFQCFIATDIDVLVLENYILYKHEQLNTNVSQKDMLKLDCKNHPTGIRRGLYSTWMALVNLFYRTTNIVSHPITWLINYLIMGFMYFGIITPLAIFFRLIDRDTLSIKYDRKTDTYWLLRNIKRSSEDYFHQF